MSLESTMIIVDNSQWTRNGDFIPTRWESQQDTVQLVITSKLQAHSESTVGIMNMARNNPEVLATLTNEFELLMASLFKSTIGGKIHFSTAVSIAQLALKHRMNKNSRQRIVVFVASPLEEQEKNLIQLGKKLKKNNVAIDVINMGQHDSDQTAKLQKFVETVNNADNSHFINVQPGISQLSDSLVGTPVLGGQMNEAGNNNYDGLVVDPNVDPELAMILRISLEEEKERQRQEEKKQQEAQNKDGKIEEEKLPLIEEEPQAEDQSQNIDAKNEKQQQAEDQMLNEAQVEEEDDDEELYKQAMALSMQPLEEEKKEEQNQKKDEIDQKLFNDENFINELLQSVPGVNLGDQEIKDLVQKMKQDETNDDEKDKKEKK